MAADMREQRYVLWSPKRGIHLGGGVWSYDAEAKTKAFAPTYLRDETPFKEGTEDIELREVVPSLAGQRASKQDMHNILLPVW